MHIQKVSLQTSILPELRAFYTEVLGLSLLEATMEQCSFQVGSSILVFQVSSTPAYYHFAFNIPSDSIHAAKAWLEQRATLLPDSETQDTIIDFSNWDAKALYFKDPAGNIVEFIARQGIATFLEGSFSSKALLSISEIGLSVKDVKASFEQIHQLTGLPHYSGTSSSFCAAGNPDGLFIIVDAEEKVWYPTEVRARGFGLSVEVVIIGTKYHLTLGTDLAIRGIN